MTDSIQNRLSSEDRVIAKCLYAYERELGDRMGFDPIKQGDHFKAAMKKALECYEDLSIRIPEHE